MQTGAKEVPLEDARRHSPGLVGLAGHGPPTKPYLTFAGPPTNEKHESESCLARESLDVDKTMKHLLHSSFGSTPPGRGGVFRAREAVGCICE